MLSANRMRMITLSINPVQQRSVFSVGSLYRKHIDEFMFMAEYALVIYDRVDRRRSDVADFWYKSVYCHGI